MGFTEVNSLRKSGKFDTALSMAEKEFNQNKDKWSASALFWVYYDLSKICNDDEKIKRYYTNMCNLMNYIPSDDIYLKCLKNIELKTNVDLVWVKKIHQEAKNGIFESKEYKELLKRISNNTLNMDAANYAAWVIYYHFKTLKSDERSQILTDISAYEKLEIQKPSLVHSLMINSLIEVYEENSDMTFNFFSKEDNIKFRDEDWIPYNDKSFSLVQKVVGVYAKLISSDRLPSDFIVTFCEEVSKKFNNEVYTLRSLAQVYRIQEKYHDSIELYKRILLKKNDSYLWEELSEMVEDLNIKESLLCKALYFQTNDKFSGKTRLRLALALINKEDFGRALCEIQQFVKIYEENNWNIEPYYSKINKYIPTGTELVDTGKSYYLSKLELADDFIYSEYTPQVMIPVEIIKIKDINTGKQKQRIKLVGEGGESVIVSINKLKFYSNSYMNMLFYVRTVKNNDKNIAVTIRPCENSEYPKWLKKFTGIVDLKKDKKFNDICFIDGCFVPPSIASKLNNGESATVIGILNKGKWMAVKK